MRKIIFRLKLALGDALGFTAGVRDFKLLFPDILIDVDTNFKEFFKNNPYITPLDKNDPEVEKYTISNSNVNNSNQTYNHYIFGFFFDMVAQAGLNGELPISVGEFAAAFSNGRVGDKEAQVKQYAATRNKFSHLGSAGAFRQKPDLHLTEEDKRIILNGVEHYWVIAPGGKSDAVTKIWDWRQFQKVINYFEGKIKFVTIGMSSHILTKLDNVIDLTDKTPNVRDIIPIVYNADGCVSGVSFLMHLAASLDKPCVSIYGGREPVSYTCYNDHQILHTQSSLTCCDNQSGCWKSQVIKNKPEDRVCSFPVEVDGKIIPKCMTMITSDDVIRAIEKYYDGNKLEYSKNNNKEVDLDLEKTIEEYIDLKYELEPRITQCSISYIYEDVLEHVKNELKTNSKLFYKKIDNLKFLKTLTSEEIKKLEELQETTKNVDEIDDIVYDEIEKLKVKRNDSKNDSKTINILASIKSQGGGDQSAIEIGRVLENSGWKVNFVPIGSVHKNYEGKFEYKTELLPNCPLLFYGNDNVNWFCENSQIYKDVSKIIIGINFITGNLKNCKHLANDPRLKAILFQNNDALERFRRESIGFDNVPMDISVGAISLDRFIQLHQKERSGNEPLIIVKTGVSDWRKYVTSESEGKGEKKFVYQKHIFAEKDIKFYDRLDKDQKGLEFRFMEAHQELVNYFKNRPNFKFYKFNEIPVDKFLSQGHIFLQRTSMLWDDSYPRSIAEAMSAGLPIICEPRYGCRDRIIHGRSGLYFIDYDSCLLNIKLLYRKEKMRKDMGKEAKIFARDNFDSKNWVKVINKYLGA